MNTYRTTVLAKLTAPIEQVQHALVPYSGTTTAIEDQEAEITVTIQAPDYLTAVITGCAKIVETHMVENLRHKITSQIKKKRAKSTNYHKPQLNLSTTQPMERTTCQTTNFPKSQTQQTFNNS